MGVHINLLLKSLVKTYLQKGNALVVKLPVFYRANPHPTFL